MNEHLNPESENYSNEELDSEKKLRPLSFDDFTGPQNVGHLFLVLRASY